MKAWERLLNAEEFFDYLLHSQIFHGVVEYDDNNGYQICEKRLSEHEKEEYHYYMKYEWLIHLLCMMYFSTHPTKEKYYEEELQYYNQTIKKHLTDYWYNYERHFEEDPEALDILIECAIDNHINPEHKLFLIDYKYKHRDFKERDWEL